jgi:hypothetical protein
LATAAPAACGVESSRRIHSFLSGYANKLQSAEQKRKGLHRLSRLVLHMHSNPYSATRQKKEQKKMNKKKRKTKEKKEKKEKEKKRRKTIKKLQALASMFAAAAPHAHLS